MKLNPTKKLKAQIDVEAKIGAKFKFFKSKVNSENVEEKIYESEWTHNLVTDWGLSQLSSSTSNLLNNIVVGSSSTAPDVSQTTLSNKIAHTGAAAPTQPNNEIQVATAPFYIAIRKTFRFAAGTATGIIAEVGLSPTGTNVFNRALVKDSNGNPSTITVLSDEILDILCEVRVYLADTISGSFPLKDKVGNTLRTVNYTGKPYLPSAASSYSFHLTKIGLVKAGNGVIVYSGSLNSGYVTAPSGTSAVSNTPDVTETPTYPTSTQFAYLLKFGASVANFTHKSLTTRISGLATNSSVLGYQVEFDEGIAKTGSETLQYSFSLSWGRYVA